MEISNIWSSAKAQIGNAIDKNAEDIALLKEKTTEIEGQISDQDRLYKVGDIITTIRKDLGDNWKVCDGSKVTSSHYYYDNIKEMLALAALDTPLYGGSTSIETPIHVKNGIFAYMTSVDTITYTSDRGVTWKTTTTPVSASGGNFYFLDDKWIVAGCSSGGMLVAYTSDLGSTWTSVNITGAASYAYFELGYADGKWVIAANTSLSGSRLYIYTASDIAGPWTVVTSFAGPHNKSMRVTGVCGNGNTWIVRGYEDTDSDNPVMYISTDKASTFTEYTPSAFSSAVSMYCDGTTWLAQYSGSKLYTTTNPTGSWSSFTIPGVEHYSSIKYANGIWQAILQIDGVYRLMTANSLTGQWVEITSPLSTSYYECEDSDNFIYTKGSAVTVYISPVRALPDISSDTATTYIKVK